MNAKGSYLFTSESVSEGHPDKVADRISDAILDAILARDPKGRAAIEVMVTRNFCAIAGETSQPDVDAEAIARRVIEEIGYDDPDFGPGIEVRSLLQQQSPEIAQAVGEEGEGAGDQGLMFGYACRETEELMPAALHHSHRILERLAEFRREKPGILGPDAKAQLTLEYRVGVPLRVRTAIVSQQHAAGVSQSDLRGIVEDVLRDVLPRGWIDGETKILVNPSGSFVRGGPAVDTGLTGRKIIVDTYGGAAPHGGGAFSGKDPTKVDRSAAYAARYLAKNVVAAGLADRCLIQLAYAIGVAEPVSIHVDTFGTEQIAEAEIAARLEEAMSLTPRGIREHLGLARPIYERTAAYGHFGRTPGEDGSFSWERADLTTALV